MKNVKSVNYVDSYTECGHMEGVTFKQKFWSDKLPIFLFLLYDTIKSTFTFHFIWPNIPTKTVSLFVGVMFMFSVVRSVNKCEMKKVLLRSKLVIVFLCYLFISSIFLSNSKLISLLAIYNLIINALFVVFIYAKYKSPLYVAAKYFYVVYLAQILLSILFVYCLPEFGRQLALSGQPWRGIFWHKSALGSLSYTLLFIIICGPLKTKGHIPQLLVATLCVTTIINSKSTQAIIIATLVCGFIFFMKTIQIKATHGKWELPLSLFFAGISGCLLFATLFDIYAVYQGTLDSLGKSTELTGRWPIWIPLFNYGLETHPFFGSGLSAFFNTESVVRATLSWDAPHSHNGYLETFLNIGFLGLFLLILMICVATKKCISLIKINYIYGVLFSAFFLAAILKNLVEKGFPEFIPISMLFLIYGSFKKKEC